MIQNIYLFNFFVHSMKDITYTWPLDRTSHTKTFLWHFLCDILSSVWIMWHRKSVSRVGSNPIKCMGPFLSTIIQNNAINAETKDLKLKTYKIPKKRTSTYKNRIVPYIPRSSLLLFANFIVLRSKRPYTTYKYIYILYIFFNCDRSFIAGAQRRKRACHKNSHSR